MDEDMKTYMVGIARRVALLEANTEEMLGEAESRNVHMQKLETSFSNDLKFLKEELSAVNDQLSEVRGSAAQLVQVFKNVTREASLERLNRKVDAWSPDKLATHSDLKRALEELE